MTKTSSTAALASALTLVISGAAQAAPALEAPLPNFTLFASMGVLDVEDKDFDPEAFELEFGVNGLIKADAFKMRYQFVADVADAVNSRDTGGKEGEGDIHVKEAKLIFPSNYGVFVLAPRSSSGVQRDMYSNINLFEYNETHNGRTTPTGNPIFNQADEGQDVLAYVTPKWNNMRMVFSTLSLSEDNSEDLDVKTARLIYDNKALNLGISRVLTEKTVVGADEDYVRTALTAGYNFGQLHMGATYEINEDTFNSNDFDSFGIAARYQFQEGLSAALGYYDKDADNDAADNNGVVFQVKKQIHPSVSLWAETGQYDNGADNIALGVNLKF
ncbi:porin-like protein [Marinobacterium halophilum]|uniref:Porin-like protein n=1 Tax=Marinobacterium halophilum TaxID=267374 RepID=A0A2P8F330_9GAMM|nr:porin [Marinobacterium halophilum]PSL16122.1 porin-like protein [Marinobacterium halophilum]